MSSAEIGPAAASKLADDAARYRQLREAYDLLAKEYEELFNEYQQLSDENNELRRRSI